MNTELMGHIALAMVWMLPTVFIAWGLIANVVAIFRHDRGWYDLVYIAIFLYAAMVWLLLSIYVGGELISRELIEAIKGLS